jgi:hypothetical protein
MEFWRRKDFELQAFAHYGRDTVDGLRVLHGSATEFHDDHRENLHRGGAETRRKAKLRVPESP